MKEEFIKNHSLQIQKIQNLLNGQKRFLVLLFAFVLAGTLGFLGYKNLSKASAANAKNFNAGDIMSDEVMGDYASMTEAEIHSFLKSKNSCNDTNVAKAKAYPKLNYHIENGHFVCMADEKFDGESAAHIIWQAAQDYKINPKVLIVLLEKEQGLVTDTWPNSNLQYRSATGYGCPDTAACDSQYYGFKNQIRNSAKFFRKNLDGNMDWTNYPVGKNYILYSPRCSERGEVNVKNRATGALYTYTPYQPNQAALNAGYGEGDYCSAYGNRNFYLYYTDWFGDTHTTSAMAKIISKITSSYTALDGENYLGTAKTNLQRNTSTGIFWIEYQKGYIVGSDKTGYFESTGKIREVWKKQGFESGTLGFPTSNIEINTETGIKFQYYQKGVIVGNDKYGYFVSDGKIRGAWADQGFESGPLGFPTSGTQHNSASGIYFQYYQNGAIVGSDKTGYFESRGKIRDVWSKQGFEFGVLGFPTSNIETNSSTGVFFQYYQNGAIVGSDKTGYFESRGKIREAWQNLKFESGPLGFPTSNIEKNPGTGAFFQYYQNGAIVGSDKTGYFESRGKIREYWQKNNFESGKFGFPTSNIKTNGDIQSQTYQKGTIHYNVKTGQVWS